MYPEFVNGLLMQYATYPLMSTIATIIVALFLLSTYKLVQFGEVNIYLNLPQPLLFCMLYYLIYAQLGPQHYQFDQPPQWWEWLQFTGAHILRAGDILDVIEEYKWDLQNIKHASNLVATTVMAMHWMVDAFLLGVLWQKAGSFLNQIVNFLLKKEWVYNDSYSLWFILLVPVLGMFFATLAVQSLYQSHSIWNSIWWSIWFLLNGLLLWPLDNLIRVIDIGDSFQLYHIQLHTIETNWWTSSLTMVFRLLISVPIASGINWIHLHYFKGVGKSIPELIKDLEDDQLRENAIKALVGLGYTTVPYLREVLEDDKLREHAIEALIRLGSATVPDLIKVWKENDKLRKNAMRNEAHRSR